MIFSRFKMKLNTEKNVSMDKQELLGSIVDESVSCITITVGAFKFRY